MTVEFQTKVIGEELKEANVKIKDDAFQNVLSAFTTATSTSRSSTEDSATETSTKSSETKSTDSTKNLQLKKARLNHQTNK